MPVTEFAKEKRAQLVQAAFRAFARNGYVHTTMQQVADEARIGKSTLYEYFGSKAELFMALHQWIVETLAERVNQAIDAAGPSAVSRLRAVVATAAGALSEMEDLCGLVTKAWAANAAHDLRLELSNSYLNLYQDYKGMVEGIIKDGISQGELRSDLNTETVARGILGFMDGVFLQAWFDTSVNIEQVCTDFFEDLLIGISRH